MNEVAVAPIKASDEKFCSECGATIKEKAEICPNCGVRQLAPPSGVNLGPVTANGKNKIAAALFAFFLGSFGAHKFYLGQVGMGILYLLFCWTFIPSIVAFIEFILLLVMSDETFNRKYGRA
ncbi:zinc-ribbon domain-containing protein [Desulfuromusa kysingii]|uniref:Zinc-ribbon domain-containing protein n=1 Tax=Desulfuromusa kysingii TaxID=37625 RepID=A0A1H3ZQM7_9BACT|nr:NINE protein [Desulfuromusa kysingii]SEA26086.1 zinc-ribbon domain-containing protein [Desulfuromusa kysingii]